MSHLGGLDCKINSLLHRTVLEEACQDHRQCTSGVEQHQLWSETIPIKLQEWVIVLCMKCSSIITRTQLFILQSPTD